MDNSVDDGWNKSNNVIESKGESESEKKSEKNSETERECTVAIFNQLRDQDLPSGELFLLGAQLCRRWGRRRRGGHGACWSLLWFCRLWGAIVAFVALVAGVVGLAGCCGGCGGCG